MDADAIKLAVRSLYDSQKLRIEMGNRMSAQVRLGVLSGEWHERLKRHLVSLEVVERELLKDVKLLCKDYDIWPWLGGVKGVGPAMGGVVLSEVRDPARFDTVSKLWAYCGLHVIDGRAVSRRKGQKANWNAFLKTKLIGVLGPSFLKCSSPYREFYDNYKTRLENRPCSMTPTEHNKTFGHDMPEDQEPSASQMRSEDHTDPASQSSTDDQIRSASQDLTDNHARCASHDSSDNHSSSASQNRTDTQSTFASQVETNTQASRAPQKLLPNGCTAGHMHNKAVRYMVKMFLADLWIEWRTIRGLDVREPYAAEYLDRKHSA